MNQKCTRKNSPPVKLYCLPVEHAQLQANARAARKSLSTYLLNVVRTVLAPSATGASDFSG